MVSGIGVPRIEPKSPHLSSDQTLIRIARGSAFLFAATFFGLGLNYLYVIVLARVLGSEQFGLYALGLGCFNLLTVIASAGLDSALLRFVPGLRAQGDAAGIKGIVGTVLVLAASFGVLAAVAMLLASNKLASQLFHRDDMSDVLKLFALSIPIFTVSTVALAALQAFREVRWRTSVKYLCEPVLKLTVTLGLVCWGWGLTAALIALPVALCLTTVLSLLPLLNLLLSFK